MNGHLGHLTHLQEEAFDRFKRNLVQAGLYTTEPVSHSDTTLLRYLRARKFDPLTAQKQFADTAAWRAKYDVQTLYDRFDVDEFEDAKRFYPRWTGRRDQGGRPVYVYRLASLAPLQSELNAIPDGKRYERICALYELVTRLMLPLCSSLPRPERDVPVSAVTTIIDLESVSLRSMWSLRSHLQTASTLATAHFPETLHATVVVNSPAFFPTVWGWIKGWFDEGTREKIHVIGRDWTELLTLIDAKDLPKAYGGELDWTFEDGPKLDKETIDVIGETWPRGPTVCVNGKLYKASEAPNAPL